MFLPVNVFKWFQTLKKIQSQLCSILLGLLKSTSHMCGRSALIRMCIKSLGRVGHRIPMAGIECKHAKFYDIQFWSNLEWAWFIRDFPAQGPVIGRLAFVTKKLTRFSCKYLPGDSRIAWLRERKHSKTCLKMLIFCLKPEWKFPMWNFVELEYHGTRFYNEMSLFVQLIIFFSTTSLQTFRKHLSNAKQIWLHKCGQ